MLKHNLLYIIVFQFVFLFADSQTYFNVSNIYYSENSFAPAYLVYLQDSTSFDLYIRLNLSELNFIQLNNRKYIAKVRFSFIMYRSLETAEIIDSTSTVLKISRLPGLSVLNTKKTFFIKDTVSRFFLVIKAYDVFSEQKNVCVVGVNTAKTSPQSFLVNSVSDNFPVYEPYFITGEQYYIKNAFNSDSFYVRRYRLDTTVAVLRTAAYNYMPSFKLLDSFYINNQDVFIPKSNSLYKIQVGDSYIYKFSVNPDFPSITTASEMIQPLKYIATSSEYQKMINAVNKKLAVDDFWLNLAKNNKDLARNLIKKYYSRVVLANYYFSSYKEGWRTDRGMLFVVLGPPSFVKEGNNYEQWVYKTYVHSYIYTFKKQKAGDFTDYFLIRQGISYDFWSKGVKIWRQ